jgi:hypothetical protein
MGASIVRASIGPQNVPSRGTRIIHGGLMHTRDIPTEQWQPVLDAFTRLHLGDQMGIDVVSAASRPKTELSRLPLIGVVAVPDCGQGPCIEVIAGTETQPQTCTIRKPLHLSVTERDDGYPVAIQITDDNGAVTVLHLESQTASSKPPGNYLG